MSCVNQMNWLAKPLASRFKLDSFGSTYEYPAVNFKTVATLICSATVASATNSLVEMMHKKWTSFSLSVHLFQSKKLFYAVKTKVFKIYFGIVYIWLRIIECRAL